MRRHLTIVKPLACALGVWTAFMLSAGCSEQRSPTAPTGSLSAASANMESAAVAPSIATVVDWRVVSAQNWEVRAHGNDVPPAPTNLSFSVIGSTVILQWNPPGPGPLSSYLIEAGSATGLSDILQFNTGSTATQLTATNVPAGRYYVRVRALNFDGAGAASNEVTVAIAGATCPPAEPTGLTGEKGTCGVTLAWNAVPGALAYIVEAGSAPGLANFASFDTGSTATTLTTRNPPTGTYYVRVRARGSCGASGVSNEIALVFSGGVNPIYCR